MRSIAFSPDSYQLATGGFGIVYLWSTTNINSDPDILRTGTGYVDNLMFSVDGRWLSTYSYHTIFLFSLQGEDKDPIRLSGHKAIVRSTAFSPDGEWLVSGNEDGSLRLWSLKSTNIEPIVITDESMSFSLNDNLLATWSPMKDISVWSLDKSNRSINLHDSLQNERIISGVRFSPNNRWMAWYAQRGSSINRHFDNYLISLPFPNSESVLFSTRSGFQFSSDSKSLAVSSMDGLRILSTANTTAPLTALDDESTSGSIYSSDGKWLASATENEVRLWLLDSANLNTSLNHEDRVEFVAFSPDNRWLVSTSNNKINIWSLDNLDKVPLSLSHDEEHIKSIKFSPNGEWMVSRGDSILLWSTLGWNNKPIILSDHWGDMRTTSFSSNSNWLATSSSDNYIRLHSLTHMDKNPIVLSGHDSSVKNLSFSSA